jgi:hypothetical protein
VEALPDDCPDGLARELADRGVTGVDVELDPPKTYLRLSSPEGGLFAWYSTAPEHEAVAAYEAEMRAAVGAEGPLRAPPILAAGPGWRLERALRLEPLQGPETIGRVVEAARELAGRELPPPPAGIGTERRLATLRRRLLVLRSPLPSADTVRARRLVRESPLPPATSHGQFSRIHVLIEDGIPWIVDWEQAALRPRGFDTMTLWADLEDEDDRALLLEESARALDADRRELERLGYAALVRLIVSTVAEPLAMNRNPERAAALLERLPAARRDAR